MFCSTRLVFGGTMCEITCFHVLHSRTRFRRYRGLRVPFSCFARPDSFSAIQRVSDLIFMFCASGLVFGGTEGVDSRFHVLHARTRFRRYRGRQVVFSCFTFPDMFWAVRVGSCFHVLRSRTSFRRYRGRQLLFSCFARSNSFSTVPTAPSPVFMFCVPRHVFGGAEGVGFLYHAMLSKISLGAENMRTGWDRYRRK
jgi:hypothetical protein